MIVPPGRIAIIKRFPGSIPQRGGGVMVSHPSTRRLVLFFKSKKSSVRDPGREKGFWYCRTGWILPVFPPSTGDRVVRPVPEMRRLFFFIPLTPCGKGRHAYSRALPLL